MWGTHFRRLRRHWTSHPPRPRLNPRRIARAPVLRVKAVPKTVLETHPAPLAPLAILTRWRGRGGLWCSLRASWSASEGYAHLDRIHAVSFMPQALARFCMTRFSACGTRSWIRASADDGCAVLGPGFGFMMEMKKPPEGGGVINPSAPQCALRFEPLFQPCGQKPKSEGLGKCKPACRTRSIHPLQCIYQLGLSATACRPCIPH